MPKQQINPKKFDADFPYRLSETDDTDLYRLRGLLATLTDLSGFAINKPSAVIDLEALHATCWLMTDLVDTIIGRYNLDYRSRKAT